MDLLSLSRLLSHTTITMSTRYTHPSQQHLFNVIAKLDQQRQTKVV